VSADTFVPLLPVKIYNVDSIVKLLLVLQILVLRPVFDGRFNPLTPELNPSAQRCLMIFFTGDFAS
jgi:hypothetical protein